MSQAPTKSHSRVVIVGAGFAGLTAAKRLAKTSLDVTVVDQHNHYLFQPLLYQVATAGLSPANIASPIRGILRNVDNVEVILAKVSGVDIARQEVVADERRIPFDHLIIATGAEHAHFGIDGAQFLPGLKSIDDATNIRRRILLAFERAEAEPDASERQRLLNFIVVGGGPTGVEIAGSMAELARLALASNFRVIDPRSARIVLVEAGPRLLTNLDPALSEAARRSLGQLGVDVRLTAGVTKCDSRGVSVGSERIESGTIIWAAGVKATPVAQWLCAEHDHAGRVRVEPDLSVPGHPNIFVIGDAAMLGGDGKAVPGDAGAAKQQGRYVAKLLLARRQSKAVPPFRYRDLGSIAAIGRRSAIVQMHWLKLSGLPGWLVWSAAHIYYMSGFTKRSIVAMTLVRNCLTLRRGVRLITGGTGARIDDMSRRVLSPTVAKTNSAELPYSAAPTMDHECPPQSADHSGPSVLRADADRGEQKIDGGC